MGKKIEKHAESDKPDRLKILLQGFAVRIGAFKIDRFKFTEPDIAKLQAGMKKGAKAIFEIAFENDKLVATVAAGGTNLTVAAVDLAKEADRAKRRKMLESIFNVSTLVDAKDLAEFDRKFPDPAKVKELDDRITQLQFEIKRDEDLKKGQPKSLAAMNVGQLEVSFARWAKGRAFENFFALYLAIETGRDATKVAQEFIVTGAPTPVKLPDATRKAVEDSIAKGKAPDLKLAQAQAAAVVSTRLFPEYSKWVNEGITKRLDDARKALTKAQEERKALTGK